MLRRTTLLVLSLLALAALAALAAPAPTSAQSPSVAPAAPQPPAALPWLPQPDPDRSLNLPDGNLPFGALPMTCVTDCVKAGGDPICCRYQCHPIGMNPC